MYKKLVRQNVIDCKTLAHYLAVSITAQDQESDMGIWPRPKHLETTGEEVVWLSAEATCQYRRSAKPRDAAPADLMAGLTVESYVTSQQSTTKSH